MLKLFRYLKAVKGSVLAILLLLVVQAYCDLSLPTYTSQIVDVGIQQGGIERVSPEQMRGSTLEALTLFLSDEDEAAVRGAYTQAEDGTYVLADLDGEARDRLDDILGLSMAAVYQMTQQGTDPSALLAQLEGAGMDRETFQAAVIAQLETVAAQYGDNADMLVEQAAIQGVRGEYEAMGLDLNQIQMDYLWLTGAKMMGVSLLMVAAAILAGLLSSRAAVRIGMELRGGVFR